ncbi:MAG: cobalt transporter [Lachnospiraceae bacterium]|nr:cobalt transporter [Lachnospiraceae bacterium]MCD8054550.1 cobalt transporter [Lachnospiraceae bacterium]MCD8124359.1 cobalt transporter [Lachnospiraceae bacterium]
MHDGHDVHSAHHHHHHDLDASSSSREEAVALLGYMVAHNEHHAEELAELAETMRGLELFQVAEEIEGSIVDFKEGNLKLRAAFALLKE